MIERTRGRHAPELFGSVAEAGRGEQFLHRRIVDIAHGLDACVGAERADVTAYIDDGFIERVAEAIARISAYKHATRLRHECGKAPDIAFNDDVRALQRDAASQPGIAPDDEATTVRRRARATAREATHFDRAGHHVLRDTGPRTPVHDNGGVLIHSSGVVASVPEDVDAHRRVEADCKTVRTIGILYAHALDAGEIAMQELIGLAHAASAQVEQPGRPGHGRHFGHTDHEYTSSGFGSNTEALRTSGRCASERNSDAIAT